jgi:L-fuconolactonase
MPYAAKLAAAVEETLFVLDHLGGPAADGFEVWREALGPLAAQPHVVAKLTGPAGWTVPAARPFVEHAVAAFEPERLMWGSRGPLTGDRTRTLALMNELLDECAPTGRRRILGGTATEVYGLE